VKRAVKRALSIFITPPSFEALHDRLSSRGTESEPERRRRLVTAERELRRQKEFDYVVVNDSVEKAGQSIVDLALASRDP
jgi:guanylate kinase